jgi:hypothetical protein
VKRREGMTRADKAREDKRRQEKTRQEKTTHDKTTQENTSTQKINQTLTLRFCIIVRWMVNTFSYQFFVKVASLLWGQVNWFYAEFNV